MSVSLLLDATVWLAALDRDDSHHTAARQLLEAAATGTATLAALDLTRLVTLVRLACPDTLERADEELLREAAAIASRDQLTVYDGVYVAAGRRRGWKLVSGDIGDLFTPGFAISPETAVTSAA